MSPYLITLIILIIAIVLFMSEKLSADLVAMMVAISLGITGVLTPQETFAGFSRSAVITIIAIFILAEGLKQAGITDRIGTLLLRIAGTTEIHLLLIVMVFSATLSLFMNNIAVAAVLLPAVIGAANQANIKPSRLLMPLSIATMLGGMATILTSTNIVSSSLLIESNIKGYSLLDFFSMGLPVTIVGIIFLLLYGRKALPYSGLCSLPTSNGDLLDTYRLSERLIRVKLVKGSLLAGKRLSQSGLREKYNLSLVAIERRGEMILSPSPNSVLLQSDVLLLEGRFNEVPWESIHDIFEVLPTQGWDSQDLASPKIAFLEAVLAPRSGLIGQTLKATNFREKYGMVVLGIWRSGRPIRSDLANEALQFGDALLLQGPRDRINVLRNEPDLIILESPVVEAIRTPRKELIAIACFLGALIFSILKPDYIALIMLTAGFLMILSGILKMEQAYRAVEWKSVFLIAGMLPMGIAITKTGLADMAAQGLLHLSSFAHPYIVVILLFLLTLALSQVVHGAVVASIMIPITIQGAIVLGMEPRSVVMGITLATSMTFVTPLGHPVSILIMGPGGYRFKDYVKIGLPLAVLLSIVILILLPLIWPIYPG